ncbi:MAG: SRPBCC family protein, partial [Bdellovibrionaceae bacterium]|nr:SRPBCC family protein [Pseudobdellovibrionaceae bacterium]
LNEVLEFQQYLPLPLEEVFSFFKNPHNLEAITPANLNFHILRISTPDIREGTLIDYRLKIRGFPVHWQTQIEEWQPPYRFVDTQLKGPYSLWHHTHSFEPLGEGVLMTDRVKFRLPLHWPGWIAAQGFVKNDVRKIFTYRRTKIPELLKF